MKEEIYHETELSCDLIDKSINKHILGEKKLLIAVLQQAINDIYSYDEKVRTEVGVWFSESYKDDGGDPYSLQFICDFLDLDFTLVKNWAYKLIIKAIS